MSARINVREYSYFRTLISSSTFQVILFSLLTAVAAQITIPAKPVPFTLQTLIVLLSGALLGSKKGAYSQILYLMLGASGLPVFAQVPDAAVGFARLFGPTGGYLLAFPVAAFLTGYIIERKQNYFAVALSFLVGDALIIASGTLYLYAFWVRDFQQAVIAGAVIFSVWSVVKVIAATGIFAALSKIRE